MNITKERAIGILEYIGSDYKNCVQSIAIDMAISALKQQSILDKIEKEINSPNRGTCDYFVIDRIEEIINKYKEESEGKNERRRI